MGYNPMDARKAGATRLPGGVCDAPTGKDEEID